MWSSIWSMVWSYRMTSLYHMIPGWQLFFRDTPCSLWHSFFMARYKYVDGCYSNVAVIRLRLQVPISDLKTRNIGSASDLSLRVTPPWSVSVGNVWRWWMALRVNLRIIYSWLQLKQSPVEGDLLLELPVAAVILFMVMGYCSWRAINFLMSPWKG